MKPETDHFDQDTRYGGYIEKLENDPSPPWRELTPKQFSDLTGITVQALANWRYRRNGPRFVQRARSRACFYRPCDVLEWLTGIPAAQCIRTWLVSHGLIPEDASELVSEHVV